MPSITPPTLTTERLCLRPLRATDAQALFAVFSDPVVARYGSTAPWRSVQMAIDALARDREDMTHGQALRLGLARRSDDALIGTCTLFHIEAECRRAEVGYGLAPSAWGQGYAGEALAALLDYAFATMHLHRLEADIDPRNQASARLLERHGFRQEGYLRERWFVGGEVSDSVLYGLLAREWHAHPRAARPAHEAGRHPGYARRRGEGRPVMALSSPNSGDRSGTTRPGSTGLRRIRKLLSKGPHAQSPCPPSLCMLQVIDSKGKRQLFHRHSQLLPVLPGQEFVSTRRQSQAKIFFAIRRFPGADRREG